MMSSSEYILIAYNNPFLMISCMLLSFGIYYCLFRRYFLSIFDPLIYSLFFSSIGFSTVVFMYLNANINTYYFLVYIFTQFAFFAGILLFKPIKFYTNTHQVSFFNNTSSMLVIKYFYLLFSLILIFFQILIYAYKGIPILLESRLNVIGDDLLFKIFNRLKDSIYIPIVLLTYYFVFSSKYKKNKLYSKIVLVFFIISSILNGAKAAFISLLLIYFVFALYMTKNNEYIHLCKLKKYTLRLFLFAIIGAIIVVNFSGDSKDSISFIIYRILISGDAYFMSLPNNVIENFVSTQNWFTNLFASPLYMAGLIDESQIPKPLGFLIMEYHHGINLFKGPNPRHNIFGYVYIGYIGGLFFSFIIGMTLGFVRNYIYKISPNGPIGLIIYGSLFFAVLKLESDFHSALASLINIVPLFITLFIAILLAYNGGKKNASKHNYSYL